MTINRLSIRFPYIILSFMTCSLTSMDQLQQQLTAFVSAALAGTLSSSGAKDTNNGQQSNANGSEASTAQNMDIEQVKPAVRPKTKQANSVCQQCGAAIKYKNYHIQHPSACKPFPCIRGLCSARFNSQEQLNQHYLATEHNNAETQNTVAPEISSDKQIYDHYVYIDKKSYQCNICKKKLAGCQGTFKDHYTAVHLGQKPFACDICNKHFGKKSALTGHCKTQSHKDRIAASDSSSSAMSLDQGAPISNAAAQSAAMETQDASNTGANTLQFPHKAAAASAAIGNTGLTKQTTESRARHHKNKCPHCCHVLASEQKLVEHIGKHVDRSEHRCVFCNCYFKNKISLTRHNEINKENHKEMESPSGMSESNATSCASSSNQGISVETVGSKRKHTSHASGNGADGTISNGDMGTLAPLPSSKPAENGSVDKQPLPKTPNKKPRKEPTAAALAVEYAVLAARQTAAQPAQMATQESTAANASACIKEKDNTTLAAHTLLSLRCVNILPGSAAASSVSQPTMPPISSCSSNRIG